MNRGIVQTATRWVLILLLALAVTAAGVWVYRHWILASVQATKVIKGPVVQAFYATGTLMPDREYPIRSSVEGVVTEVLVDKGDQVSKGQPLAKLRADDYVMKFRQAQADYELKQQLADDGKSPVLQEFDAKLASANEQLAVAKREYQRISEMRQAQAASTADMDRANRQLQDYVSLTESLKQQRATRCLELHRDLQIAKQALDIAQWNMDRQTITSPVDGVVLDRPTPVGTRLGLNAHLMQVADVCFDKLVMRASVDEEDKTRLKSGQKVVLTLYAYPDRPFEGVVKTIYPKADEQRRTFEVDVAIAAPDAHFSAGMTGELAFIVAEKQSSLVVPSQAVAKDHVWVVKESKAYQVGVTTGLRSLERTEILTGLSEGQIVILSPGDNLREGQRVVVEQLDPAAAANLNKPDDEDGGFNNFR